MKNVKDWLMLLCVIALTVSCCKVLWFGVEVKRIYECCNCESD